MPVPETNGDEWDRLEDASALDVLVELALHGEYNGLDGEKRLKDALELRVAAVNVFENFVRQEDIRLAILQGMLPVEGAGPSDGPSLLHALAVPPDTSNTLDRAASTTTHIAAFLFAHLLRSSVRAKALARAIKPPAVVEPAGGNFFVPADGAPPPEEPAPPEDDDDDPPQALLPLLSEHLSLAALARARADTDADPREAREWDRFIAAHLCLLAQWLWDEPAAVREFLDAGGMSVLVDAINQTNEGDALVPGLCAFLLGVCYEFNREPGEITRATIHPILHRLGVETLVGRITRLREDERFRSVGPDSVVLPYPIVGTAAATILRSPVAEKEKEGEIWFDWAFVDFWKSNYYTVQRGLSTEPDQLTASSSGQSVESAMLIASLRDAIRNQTQEIETLQRQLKEKSNAPPPPPPVPAQPAGPSPEEFKALQSQIADLTAQNASLSSQLEASETKRKEVEKEQEDLLVLLDEVSAKRKTDKARLEAAGMEVSEDEADDDDEE
nr:predicted protein [Mycena chlorophos]